MAATHLSNHNLHQPQPPMAATLSTTMAILNTKCMTMASSKPTTKPLPYKPISLLSLQTLATSKPSTLSLTGTTIAGAIFATLSSSDAAFAAQQLADIAEGDNRGIALLLPLVPAIAWVLYNIFQPAVNQINRMRTKGVVVGLGLGGGLAASGLFATPDATAAGELAVVAEAAAAAANDNRGQLLLIVIAPAILWVLYNILQPALNQINKMRN